MWKIGKSGGQSACVMQGKKRVGTRRWWVHILTCLILTCSAAVGFGQAQNTGTISGNVTDAQSRVMVGASVVLINTATDAKRSETSNAKGEYLFSDVAVGDYILTVTAPGFEALVIQSLHVDADQNVREDAPMKAGSVNEQVTVESSGTTLDTRSATLGTLIDKNEVENLPVDGSNVVSLTALLPGVSNVNAPTTFTSDTAGPTFNISGSRNNQNLFLLDGQLWNNLFYNTGLNYPPIHTLQEVSILLNNYKAQYGRNVGSIMNVLTRSGSNTFHGAAWEYIQNHALNASDYISQINPQLVQNQFGVTVGGPIQLNKLFFYLAVQDLRVAQDVFTSTSTLSALERGYDVAPTAGNPGGMQHPCQWSGWAGLSCANFGADFPTVPNAGSKYQVPYYNEYLQNPLASSTNSDLFIHQANRAAAVAANMPGEITSACYNLLNLAYTTLSSSGAGGFYNKYLPYEELPSACFNPVSTALLNKYVPYPNATGTQTLPVLNLTAKQPRNDWDGLVRLDYIRGRQTLDARFYITNVNDVTSNSATNQPPAAGIANYEQDANAGGIYYGNLGDTLVVTPNLLNVFRVGYKRYNYTILPTDPTTLNSLGSVITQPAVVPCLPAVEVINRFRVGNTSSCWSFTVNEDEEIDDNLSWTHGNHNFQFGAQYLHLQYLHRFDSTPSLQSGLTYTQASAADFVAGLLTKMTVGNLTNLGALQDDYYFYAQDDWRASAKLTLNYGIRYELPLAWHSADGQGVTFSPGFQSKVLPTAPSNLGYEGDPYPGNAKVRSRYNNVAPRLGFAYDVGGNGRTLIRGGAGIFFDALNAAVVGVGAPFHYQSAYNSSFGGISDPLYGQSQPNIPANYTKGNLYFGTPSSVNFVDPNVTMPYTIAVNFGFQQRIRTTGVLEVNYVGKWGRHQLIQYDLNPGIFDCSGVYYQANPVYCPGSPTTPFWTLSSTTAANTQDQRVTYPGFAYGGGGAVKNASVGMSNYNGLQVMYTQRAKRSLQMKASYTYAKSLDIQSNGQTSASAVPLPSNLRSQYAASDFDSAHVANVGWVWNLPKMTTGNRFSHALANGWLFSGVYSVRTGTPVNLTLSGDTSFTGEPSQRPNVTPGMTGALPGNRHRSCTAVLGSTTNCKVQEWFNNVSVASTGTTSNSTIGSATVCVAPAAFCTPGQGTFGNVGRNSLRGPGYIATNMAIGRIFSLPKRPGTSLEFKADAFNIFNTPNLANPSAQLSNSATNQLIGNFGKILSTVGTNGNVGTNGRRMQLSLVLRY